MIIKDLWLAIALSRLNGSIFHQVFPGYTEHCRSRDVKFLHSDNSHYLAINNFANSIDVGAQRISMMSKYDATIYLLDSAIS